MKFEISSMELKSIIEKAATVTPRKSSLSCLERIYFKAEDSTLEAYTTDIERYLILTCYALIIEPGTCALDIADIKPFIKAKGTVTIEATADTITIIQENKKISVYNHEYDLQGLKPTIDNEEFILSINEAWFLDSFSKIAAYTAGNESANEALKYVNINTSKNRIEAIDGHRVATRELPSTCKRIDTNKLLISNSAISAFKKILDKKSDNNITISASDKYITISGNGFTYIQRAANIAQFFDLDQFMDITEIGYGFNIDREELAASIQDIKDLASASDRKPTVFSLSDAGIKTSYKNSQYSIESEISTSGNTGHIEIGLNHNYVYDVCKTAECDTLECYGATARTPLMISANDYKFLILPINLDYAA